MTTPDPTPAPLDLDAIIAECGPDCGGGILATHCRALVARVRHLEGTLATVELHADVARTYLKAAAVVGEAMEARIVALTGALAELAERHGWMPGLGPCRCAAHTKAAELLTPPEGTT